MDVYPPWLSDKLEYFIEQPQPQPQPQQQANDSGTDEDWGFEYQYTPQPLVYAEAPPVRTYYVLQRKSDK